MNILIDMDGVICTEEKTFERSLAVPLPAAKESLELLKSAGHQIIIYTARSWAELAMTKSWLERHEIPYDGLHMGKPIGDRFIDDRAISFKCWTQTLECLENNEKRDIDELYLAITRNATLSFLNEIVSDENLVGPILEIGPMSKTGSNSRVYERLPQTFLDVREAITKRGLKYLSLDVDSASQPDIIADFSDVESFIPSESIGSIIMMNCLEHMPKLYEVPNKIHAILKPGGRAFFLTPFNLRFHGPRPDCWRISDDGYRALFNNSFNIEMLDTIPCDSRPLMPIAIRCVIKK